MRLAGFRSLLFWALAVLMAGSVAGCDNPFDPLNTSDEIQGLAFFDFTASQEHWDADPEWDGVQITLAYYNTLGDQLEFHDKPHKVVIEIYTEEGGDEGPPVLGSLLASKTIEYSNSDDLINVPIEFYGGALSLPAAEAIKGCVLVRIFPPKEKPQRELFYPLCAIDLFTPEEAIFVP